MTRTGDLFRAGMQMIAYEKTAEVIGVARLTSQLAAILEQEPSLADVWVRGEITNLSESSAGHCYFTLKEGDSQLRVVLFRANVALSPARPRNGQLLVAHGSVRFYHRQGACQLLADLVFPEGMGLAEMKQREVARRLEAEGLFSPGRKRPLPRFPRNIGVISSDAGAVIHDLLTILGRKYPLGHVVFLAAPVQGEWAASALSSALALLNQRSAEVEQLDLIVLARGGGSADDLAPFNDERLVRAIFASRVPVVSAVGHETDTTLADMVADLRAPTPSAAAEMIVPDLAAIRSELPAFRLKARRALIARVAHAREETRSARGDLEVRLARRLQSVRDQVNGERARLSALSPLATLDRGYAIAEHEGRVLVDSADVGEGDSVRVRLRRGRLTTSVTATHS